MQVGAIRGETRPPGGRRANERLRRRGLVPAVIYGHGETPETIALLRHDLLLALGAHTHLVQVDVDGAPRQYLIKDVQYDHLQAVPIHVDLMRVDIHERVTVAVEIVLKGEARGTKEGGELLPVLTELEVEAPVIAIPESIVVNIRDLGIDQSIYVKDLLLPEGVTTDHDPSGVVATVRMRKVAAEAPAVAAPAEGAAEPEVISKGAKEAEEAAE